MINLLRTLDLGRVMREVLVDVETEMERAAFIHALVGLDREGEVQDVVGVGEGHFHRASEGEFLKICFSCFMVLLVSLGLVVVTGWYGGGGVGFSTYPAVRAAGRR